MAQLGPTTVYGSINITGDSACSGDTTCNGDITASGNVSAYSDARIKENLEIIPNALDKVIQLTGYTYDRTDINTNRQTGLLAQDLQEILPEAVLTDNSGTLSISYGNTVGLLVEAIKDLKSEIDYLKEQLNK